MRQNTRLRIYRNRLEANIEKIKKKILGKSLIPMIKANGYGHGLDIIANFFEQDDTIGTLGVACLNEAMTLRKTLKLGKKRVFIFSDTNIAQLHNREEMLDFGVIPVVSSMDDLEIFLDCSEFKKMPLVLKLDSGMNRLGIQENELTRLIKTLKIYGRLEIEHLMSHLGCSYLVNHSQNEKQMTAFSKMIETMKTEGVRLNETSLFNSGAIEQNFQFDSATHVRPGLMMYGPQSTMCKKNLWDGEVISDLETKVVQARLIQKGDKVGYGATICKEDGVILALPIGYGDGLSLGLEGFEFEIEGKRAYFIGRVNMDLALVWVDAKEPSVYRNKRILIWEADSNHFNSIARHTKTHAYDTFCSLNNRVSREYIE